MATGSANREYNGTLTASTVDTITLNGYSRHILVTNTLTSGTTGDIYVTAMGSNTGASVNPATPTVGGAEEYCVVPGASLAIPVSGQWPSADDPHWPLNQVIVKLIATGTTTPTYNVSLT